MNESTKTKVAIMLPSLEVGGAERLVLNELNILKNDHRFYFEVHLVYERGPLFDEFLKLKIPVVVWNARHKSFSSLWTYLKVATYLRKNHFAVLHYHLLNKYGSWVGILGRVDTIITSIHTRAQLGRLENFGLRRSHSVLACGEAVAKHLQNHIKLARIKVLKNAIHIPERDEKLRTSAEKISGIEQDQKIVLSVGRLIHDKGYDVLIEAFRIVAATYPNALLLIAGEGHARQQLQQQINEASLDHNVRLLGTVRDVAPLYERADIYVNSSRREGLPLTILEAMANRKAIIATDAGGNSEIIKDGITGVLVEQANPDALANAIKRLFLDEGERIRIASQAYALVQREYNISEHCKQLASVYLS